LLKVIQKPLLITALLNGLAPPYLGCRDNEQFCKAKLLVSSPQCGSSPLPLNRLDTETSLAGVAMPHVIVKLWPGKSERQKTQLAEEITKDVMSALGYGAESVSVALEEIGAEDWKAKVYTPDIINAAGKLYKKPGYKM
jgi:4-oxalocrotonate tautomerase